MARYSPYSPLPDGTMKNLKETADLSRNLVAAEYGTVEPPTKNGRLFEPQTKNHRLCTAAAARGAILLGLLALLSLAVWRELQVWRIRSDVEELRSIVEGLRLNLNKLNEERSLLTDLNAFEDEGVFADLDGSEVVEDSFVKPETRFHKSEKAEDLPRMDVKLENNEILADDNEDDDDEDHDDEEMYDEDGEDETSGMYDEYDRRTDGRSMMVKPDEYLGRMLSVLPNNEQYKRPSKIKELRRMLDQDKPSVPQAKQEKEQIANIALTGDREKRSVSLEPPPQEFVDEFAASRFRQYKPAYREVQKKFPTDDPELIAPLEYVEAHRRTRESDDKMTLDRKVFVAAHFHGNTSHLNTETHPHYKGNGLVQVAHDAHHNVWSPAQWARAPHAPVLTRRGHVRVRKTGIYFVYVQIYYLDAHDISGWVLHRSVEDGDKREPLLQCAATSPSEQPRDKPNSCYSAAALLLNEGDRLSVRNTGGDRHSLMQPEKSFIGLIKLADAEEQQQDY